MNAFFDFSDRHKTALINFLQEALAKNNEFEIRFGKFWHGNDKRATFDSNFDIESFYNLKKMLQNMPKKEIITQEYIYKNGNGNGTIKKIINLDTNNEEIVLKNTLKKYDIYDYNLRLSISYEKSKGITLDQHANHELIRNKKRTSYMFEYGHLDLTIVTQELKNGVFQQKYEVELEITNNSNLESIMSLISVVLQTRQDNYYIISEMHKKHVIDEYKKLTNASYFIGAQPETLHKDKISTLYKEEYSVTDKADGERAFMYINNSNQIFFIDNNLNRVYRTDLTVRTVSDSAAGTCLCIIDGELVKHEQKIYFLAFDIMFYNGNDLRGNNDYNLKVRLDILNSVINNINVSNYYNVQTKKYYYTNVFMGAKIIMNTINEKFYKNDGLIFTPVNEPYPKKKKWPQLLKWKPSELNSIDFYSVKIASENGIGKWQLYVQATTTTENTIENENMKNNRKNINKTQKVLFDIEKLFGCEKTSQITYETTFREDLIDPSTDEYYQNNTVIEYKYDNENKQFVPMRTRWDKTINPEKHGNFSKVAGDIWNNIHNPIEQELLFQFTVNSNKDIYFEKMRKFHNKVKEYLYNKYCKDIHNLLELCSGKGGDLHKWIYNNIKNVYGYDISEKNIAECIRRTSQINSQGKFNTKLNTKFYKLDLTKNNSNEIIYNNNPDGFNVISCQFGIHYFFESESNVNNLIKILDKSLNNNGYFIITFLDNTKLDNLFNNKNLTYYEKNGEILYLLETDSYETTPIYGNKLKIVLNGNNILGEGSKEWIIDFEHFKNVLELRGYKCIETELFENIYNDKTNLYDSIQGAQGAHMTYGEQNISFLNRFCVFQKISIDSEIKENKLPLPKDNINMLTDIKKEFNFETIDLQQKNMSVYKIENLYDIIDIINCIDYKYYKYNANNKNIDENFITNINKLFSDLNIEYTPKFINDPLNFNEYSIGKCNIYFTNYKYTIEKRQEIDNNSNENIEYNNWYIIMYNEQILFDKPVTQSQEAQPQEIQSQETQPQQAQLQEIRSQETLSQETQSQETQPQETQPQENSEILKVKELYENLKTKNEKITIKILKDLLSKLNLKTSGKKEELQIRLEKSLN